MIKKILNFFKIPADIIISITIIPSAIIMILFRKIGSHKLKISKSILKKIGVYPITDNYYEPLFNFDNLKNELNKKRNLPGVSFNINQQIQLLEKLNFSNELKNLNLLEGSPNYKFNIKNNFFGAGDAEIYYQMIRYYKPKQIIEIGSGHSSLIAKEAIDKNSEEKIISKIICIEPYENKWLEENNINVIRKKIEDVEDELLTQLDANDIIFIDSSHIIRPQGDIVKIYLEILPKLQPGIIIHIHDIFSPRDYLNRWLKKETKFYNEQYMLESMLDHSNRYSVLLSLNLLKNDYFEKLSDACPYLKEDTEPSSFYIKTN